MINLVHFSKTSQNPESRKNARFRDPFVCTRFLKKIFRIFRRIHRDASSKCLKMWSTIIFGFLQCHHVTVQFWPDLYRSHHHFWYSVGCIQFCLKKSSDELRERTSLTSFHSKEEILSVTSRFPPYQLRKTNRYVPGRRETRQSEFSKLYLRKMLVSQMKVLRSSKTFPIHFANTMCNLLSCCS